MSHPTGRHGWTLRHLLECLSQMSRLIKMVKALQTFPITENEVADMIARRAKEK